MNKPRKPERAKARTVRFVAVLSLAVVALAVGGTAGGWFDAFERQLLDLRYRTFNQHLTPSPDVVYIDIDEGSLASVSPDFGGWPWPRGTVISNHLLSYIAEAQPASILIDIMYSELSSKSKDVAMSPEDQTLVDTSLLYPVISQAALFGTDTNAKQPVPMAPESIPNFAITVDDSRSTVKFPAYQNYRLPFSPLAEYAGSIHSVNHEPDVDGVSRSASMLVHYDGHYYPSLTLRGLIAFLGAKDFALVGQDLRFTSKDGQAYQVPLAENGNYRDNYYASYAAMNAIPADNIIASSYDVAQGKAPTVPASELKGKIVIIGASAQGLRDTRVSPVGGTLPGPYIHITAISNILQKQHLWFVPPVPTAIVSTVLAFLIMALVLLNRRKVVAFGVGSSVVVVPLVASLFAFQSLGWVIPLAAPGVVMAFAFVACVLYQSIVESRERRKLHDTMGKYLAPAVMSEVLGREDELVGEVGRKMEISVLFSDIRGFTTISEHLEAERVVAILNEYFKPMIDVVFQNRGTMDKMIGDAIMAFWGAPNQEARKEYLAVKTALDMHRELELLNAAGSQANRPRLDIGVGINTGAMIVGNIGSEKRLDYTAIGDDVNLGSRLEGLTKHYKTGILVSETTYLGAKDDFLWTYIDTVAVKGKEKGIRIYTPLGERDSVEAKEREADAQTYAQASEAYLGRRFSEAGAAFQSLKERKGILSGTASIFVERCSELLKDPPPADWDGTWKMIEK